MSVQYDNSAVPPSDNVVSTADNPEIVIPAARTAAIINFFILYPPAIILYDRLPLQTIQTIIACICMIMLPYIIAYFSNQFKSAHERRTSDRRFYASAHCVSARYGISPDSVCQTFFRKCVLRSVFFFFKPSSIRSGCSRSIRDDIRNAYCPKSATYRPR